MFKDYIIKHLKINYIFYIGVLIILYALSKKLNTSFLILIYSFVVVGITGYFVHVFSHKFSFEEMYTDVTKGDPEYYLIRRFVDHPNCTLNLALRISTMKVPENQLRWGSRRWDDVKQAALMKAALITKREGATSR